MLLVYSWGVFFIDSLFNCHKFLLVTISLLTVILLACSSGPEVTGPERGCEIFSELVDDLALSLDRPDHRSLSIMRLIVRLEYLAVDHFHDEETSSYDAYRLWNAASITANGGQLGLANIDTGIYAERVANSCTSLGYSSPESDPQAIRLYIERAVTAQ